MNATRLLSPLQHAAALAAIRTAPLRHVGLAPTHERSNRVVAAVPIDPAANVRTELDYALNAALSYWPDCQQWSIYHCDEVSQGESIPPDFVLLHSPEEAGQFSSS
jgi:hypothetical protein